MSYPTYYPVEGDTLPVLFNTYAKFSGGSITMTGLAVTDIKIYKDGNPTQRASESGYTLLDTDGTDFDGVTGIHGFSVNLADNTDPGFYEVGPWYHVIISTITIDGETVSFVAAAFRIDPASPVVRISNLPANFSDLVITEGTGLVTPIDVDGVTFTDYIGSFMAVIFGVTEPGVDSIDFKERDGVTTKVTVGYGNNDGERVSSVIA